MACYCNSLDSPFKWLFFPLCHQLLKYIAPKTLRIRPAQLFPSFTSFPRGRRCPLKNNSHTSLILLIYCETRPTVCLALLLRLREGCGMTWLQAPSLGNTRLGRDYFNGKSIEIIQRIIVALEEIFSLRHCHGGGGEGGPVQVLSHTLIKVWKDVKHTSLTSLTSLTSIPGKQFFLHFYFYFNANVMSELGFLTHFKSS